MSTTSRISRSCRLFGGLRIGDICGLRPVDVDEEAVAVFVDSSKEVRYECVA